MSRPRALDLFCCAGGSTRGLQLAGYEVTGVDDKPQPHYCGDHFERADAMTFPLEGFDVIFASPPCQDHSVSKHTHAEHGTGWMLQATVERLKATGVPWVVENVAGAEFGHSLVLCGTQFGLKAQDDDGRWLYLRRHRLFASSEMLLAPGRCTCANHCGEIGGVYGAGTSDRTKARTVRRGGYTPRTHVRRALMGIDWMTGNELSQALPPAYTEFIGEQLLNAIERAA